MRLFSLLLRVLFIAAAALVGLGLFLVAVIAFVGFLIFNLLRGRKPDLRFRVGPNPWARRQPPAGEIVDVEAREVSDAASLPPPRR